MNWPQLLSLNKHGDKENRLRKDQNETRLGFEVDYDRITFSSAFRSLQDKTQVIPFSKTDFVHTRLTHSLEVSVVGRSLGRRVGGAILKKYPELENADYKMNDFGAIVAAACLSHDIGNPPFGHSGEKAIGAYFETGNGKRFQKNLTAEQFHDLTHFEGNANGFKLLTKTKDGSKDGLRLSFATLGAFTKYPKESLPHKPTKEVSDKKFGFFQSEKEIFKNLATDLGLTKKESDSLRYQRHPLAFLVEAADDICYNIIDFEDGINLGWIDESYAESFLNKLVEQKIIQKNYKQLQTKKARVGYLRSLAISTLIEDATRIFLENENKILTGDFHHSLMDLSKFKHELDQIIDLSINQIYKSPEVTEKEILGHQVITGLLDCFSNAIERKRNGQATHHDGLILRQYLSDFDIKTEGEYYWLIDLCSYIADFSDSKAKEVFRKLKGLESL
jgi:dGTPase